MSTNDNNHDTLYLDPQVFAPMLNDNLVAHNPTLHISNPLTVADFTDTKFGDTFVDNLDDILDTITYGFKDNQPSSALNKEQWLWATAQIMATIHQGLYKTFPLEDMLEFLATLGLDDTTAVGTLSYYLKNMSGTHWKQCTRCL